MPDTCTPPNEVQEIAEQVHKQAKVKKCRLAYQTVGHLLTEAAKRGAFPGVGFIQLHRHLDVSQYNSRWPYESVFFAAVSWFREHTDELPTETRTGWFMGPAMRGGAYTAEYFQQNIVAVADVLRALAMLSAANVAPAAPEAVSKLSDGENGSSTAIVELERATPAFNRDDGKWVKNTLAAQNEGVETRTLAQYRQDGIVTDDGMFGRDNDGRIWRRPGTPSSHPWYLRVTLKSSQANITQNRR